MKKSPTPVQLTKAEEQIMQALWTLKQATVQDILEVLEAPKPARTTVSTVLTILENKGFVSHTTAGRVNTYLPLIKKEQYSRSMLSGLLHNYFNGSFATMASFFAKDNNYSIEELDQMIEQTRKELTEEQKK
ncbi:BlaI/MecI/CopY family transcriptional regulator [Pedobacter antarcticus]|uniref:BlaI/MecI/CopY family transcriptional regulator n=1 Tax=Pedobacter antarcticus TaxID=34086 RepID=UPI0008809AA0|nr:BlaI/MecI/CopY family transcriptional regulator [Pedobacter antarcticus]SDM59943.1 Predicted transcriptional regulator [Pedobacter antarcticus]